MPGPGEHRCDEVREATGYAAGGTPPFGHLNPLRVFADPALRRHDPVWAAAGTPTTVFPISIEDLDRLASRYGPRSQSVIRVRVRDPDQNGTTETDNGAKPPISPTPVVQIPLSL